MPGFRTELTGLNHEEALALLAAGSGASEQGFGLGSALASALRKVVDALPESHRATATDAAQRFLIDPQTDLLSRRHVSEEPPQTATIEVRRALLVGHKPRITTRPRTLRHGGARWTRSAWSPCAARATCWLRDLARTAPTYRLSRVLAAEALPEPAQRPDGIDLDQAWR